MPKKYPTSRHNPRLGQKIVISTTDEKAEAFIPPLLPPKPPVEIHRLYHLLETADQALGRLDGITSILPDTSLFLFMYIKKEALLSSQIEGTQSTFSDILLSENQKTTKVIIDDVKEVLNYIVAMQYGLERIQKDNFPLSSRLIREIHKILLESGRGKSKSPGEFRRSQNWIGGTRPGDAQFVPPPQEHILSLIDNLEKFIHKNTPEIPTLIKVGLVHVQFETIHPFLDGNGRLGRLLITLMLCAQGILKEPILYLSLYFKTHREKYYELLQQVRETGDWETWLEFFLTGIRETAEQAVQTTKEIIKLFEEDKKKIEGLGRPATSALKVHQFLQNHLVVEATQVAKNQGMTTPTAIKSIQHLQKLGMLKEITGRKRKQIFVYTKYLDILQQGAEPL